MSELNEQRELMKAARELSCLSVDSASARDAVRAVRQRLLNEAHGARPRLRAMLVPGSIAAVLMVAAALVLSFIIFGSPVSSAAQQVRRAAASTRAYKGWVHIRVERQAAAATKPAVAQPSNYLLHFD